ncbi:MAG: anaerobic ribonucleoside-triphosphate reductase activating protein [Puniceicoccales bacterium]|jgi:pyruvate formate lyase activating enzyme|nr:anaerobic ribonucleoside-triphosphate reductase activating protein [Puniceicoccales bacterium]
MIIGGLQRFSTIDFPGKLAAVVFTKGCNLRCPFCHNPELVSGKSPAGDLEIGEVFNFLRRRVGQLDGVVVSGGEPTLHDDLADFVFEIKTIGFDVKLDTNGTRPDVINSLLDKELLTYIAMDMKHVYTKYATACGTLDCDVDDIKKSASLLICSGIDHEFRTTMVPGIHTLSDVPEIAAQLIGAKRFAVQEFIPKKTLSLGDSCENTFSREDLEPLRPMVEEYVDEFVIRY